MTSTLKSLSCVCVCVPIVCQGSKHGDTLALQLMDVSLRVEEVREYAVHKAVGLLLDQSLITVSGIARYLHRYLHSFNNLGAFRFFFKHGSA